MPKQFDIPTPRRILKLEKENVRLLKLDFRKDKIIEKLKAENLEMRAKIKSQKPFGLTPDQVADLQRHAHAAARQ